MQEKMGLIFDIQSYSVHDGPGCRTLVFLSGCPLKCQWCANVEGWEYRQRLMFRMTKCVHESSSCHRCVDVCSRQAITVSDKTKLPVIDWKKCWDCLTFDCTKACLKEAMEVSGRWMSGTELMCILTRDRNYWGSNGGVTFSGGEPLFQKEFIMGILKRCKEAYLHTVIETTGCIETEFFLDAMRYVDFVFIDIKHMNSIKHKEKTGVGNELILKNIKSLQESDWPGRLVIRMPLIENFNDNDENIIAQAEFLHNIGLREVNILPFHRMGESKWRQVGMDYPYKEVEGTPDKVLERVQALFLDRDILCYVGSDTPF